MCEITKHFKGCLAAIVVDWKSPSDCASLYLAAFIAINSLAIADEMWFLTAGPVVCIPMILTEFPQGKNCGSFFKKHNFDKTSPIV